MTIKQTPKRGCSCGQCKNHCNKSAQRRQEEKAFRGRANASLKKGDEFISVAPTGRYVS